ncbi:ABC transporter permease [Paenibacillus xylaniclasticus]|uniref:ABC transporter permease n=1 Tax=Paenibacillus xylaniclasticus TaxID=588083 RepID=UPI00174F864B|nr:MULTISPECIES: ABC transporter permease subunit [Paenibacillus]GFN33341.1 sugar ABC transporter permease [Paenibacillus curdlanolyticus]
MALRSNLQKYGIFYLMMLPGFLILLVNNYLPMAGIVIAFKSMTYQHSNIILNFIDSEWVGLDNFKYLFKTSDAWIITRNTLLYNSLFIVLNLIIPVAFAIMLNELRSKFLARFHQSIIFLPYILSWVVISYLVYGLLHDKNGFVNTTILPMFGVDPVQWYFKLEAWPYILPLVNTVKNVGYYMVIYMAAIIGIDDEYYEAATIDGANKWQQIWKITIPLLIPIMIIMTLLQVGRIFYADFGLFYQVPKESGPLFPVTNVIDTYVYRTFLAMGDSGLSSAAGLYQSVVGFVLVFISNWVVRRIDKDSALF